LDVHRFQSGSQLGRQVPAEYRRRLKELKRREQGGICPLCKKPLPKRYCVLDRTAAAKGYTPENTRLLCQACDVKSQASKGYT
jgi:hypothetical protein